MVHSGEGGQVYTSFAYIYGDILGFYFVGVFEYDDLVGEKLTVTKRLWRCVYTIQIKIYISSISDTEHSLLI